METKISVKIAGDIDHTNAYYVTDSGGEHVVWTNSNGRGLWIDGKQHEGQLQFNAGKNPAAAIRRYFQNLNK